MHQEPRTSRRPAAPRPLHPSRQQRHTKTAPAPTVSPPTGGLTLSPTTLPDTARLSRDGGP